MKIVHLSKRTYLSYKKFTHMLKLMMPNVQ